MTVGTGEIIMQQVTLGGIYLDPGPAAKNAAVTVFPLRAQREASCLLHIMVGQSDRFAGWNTDFHPAADLGFRQSGVLPSAKENDNVAD